MRHSSGVKIVMFAISCSESGEIEDEITDLIQHIQRVHCLENRGCICYAANENRVCSAVSHCNHNKPAVYGYFKAMTRSAILCQ